MGFEKQGGVMSLPAVGHLKYYYNSCQSKFFYTKRVTVTTRNYVTLLETIG